MKSVRQKLFGPVITKILVVASILIQRQSGYAASFCSSYEFYHTRTIWTAARQRCQSSGGDLVAMESQEEWEFLKSKVSDLRFQHHRERWYIGLTNVSGKWCWITSNGSCIEVTVGSSRWSLGEPNNFNREGCVQMLKDGLYNNVPCRNNIDAHTGYICEREFDCNTSDAGKIIFKSQNATVLKVPSKAPGQKESQDVGTTRRGFAITLKVTKPRSKTTSSTVSQLSFPRKSPNHRMTIVFNPTKDTKDYRSITNITIISKIPDGSKSNVSWMIAALVGWAVVIALFVWLMMLWKRLKKDPKERDSTRNKPRKQTLPNHKTGDIQEEVTFMNLTEIRSQMSEQEDGYTALNMHKMMRPTDATYTSLLKS